MNNPENFSYQAAVKAGLFDKSMKSTDTTVLQQAFIALCGSYSNLFGIQGTDKKNDAIAFEIVIDSAQKLIDCAEKLKTGGAV